MISVGVTGWGDHESLYPDKQSQRQKLPAYSRHFSIVELDSSFYAIQSLKNYQKWREETPADFSFVVKAYQGMTGHLRGDLPFPNVDAMFEAFLQSIEPLRAAGKLKAVLFQYPPWFDCQKKNVDMLIYTKQKMDGIPCAVEFRHASWFAPELRERTLLFLEKQRWVHTICDEPQTETASIPAVLQATHPDLTLVRFHGRNVHGWNNRRQSNWRAIRCLYRYNEQELQQWAAGLRRLEQQSKEICVFFNNNSGGDAADNAKQLMRILGLQRGEEEPEQIQLF
ncbi:DUF72 domain-containing protein [Ectobacillus ponti]|uniref:DUF72 domain-containing protein n=1 Tax=Ectobacillus ponti TaxID=2961894 RepID=A0AA42BPQ6_9BACI|nr:DUF72 domain-containing protein [Ectobacillus ponti]MCP8968696.1 DUF72 domain-containing protein [Ectobacillus ponti]